MRDCGSAGKAIRRPVHIPDSGQLERFGGMTPVPKTLLPSGRRGPEGPDEGDGEAEYPHRSCAFGIPLIRLPAPSPPRGEGVVELLSCLKHNRQNLISLLSKLTRSGSKSSSESDRVSRNAS